MALGTYRSPFSRTKMLMAHIFFLSLGTIAQVSLSRLIKHGNDDLQQHFPDAKTYHATYSLAVYLFDQILKSRRNPQFVPCDLSLCSFPNIDLDLICCTIQSTQ